MSLADIEKVVSKGSVEDELLHRIDFERLPAHVAIIMDGNGRWAQNRGLPRVEGHRAGIASVREVVETCARMDIGVLTLYAFSLENWKRPKKEVDTLMKLLKRYLGLELSTLQKNNIRFQVIGRTAELPDDVVSTLEVGMERTHDNTGLLFNIALNYGGRAEIVDACRSLIREALSRSRSDSLPSEGQLTVDEKALSDHMYTAGMPDPDLLIRTSGEVTRVQLLALADRLCGDLGHRDTVAGLPQATAFRSHYRLPETRSSLRRHPRSVSESQLRIERE